MSGFSGRLILEGFDGRSEDDVRPYVQAAFKKAEVLRAWKDTQGMDSVAKAYNLGGGVVCDVGDYKHLRVLRISIPPGGEPGGYLIEEPFEESDENPVGIKDFVNGVVHSASITKQTLRLRRKREEGDDLSRADFVDQRTSMNDGYIYETREEFALVDYKRSLMSEQRYSNDECKYKLAILPNQTFGPSSNPLSGQIFSQYTYCKSSQYSGAMQRVVQLLLGAGRHFNPRWEETWLKNRDKEKTLQNPLTSLESDDIKVEVQSGFDLSEDSTQAIQLQYDYRFSRTHGIAFNTKGEPWIIEISPGGTYAMPLYMDPVSQTKEGKKRYIDACPELEEFIDEFGGIPTFESLSSGDERQYKINAGEIVELKTEEEMGAFYDNQMITTDMGWAFNDKGREAHNICVAEHAFGFAETQHWALQIQVGSEEFKTDYEAERAALATFFKPDWLKRKCYRMSGGLVLYYLDLFQNAEPEEVETVLQQFLDEEVSGASGNASFRMMQKGIAFHPAVPEYQPQIKYPESLLGGNISFDFSMFDLRGIDYLSETYNIQAPMHVCFIDNKIHVVYYTRDARDRGEPRSENTKGFCQYEGQWMSYSEGVPSQLQGHFYSTAWDSRDEFPAQWTKSVGQGAKVGTTAYASTDYFFSSCITEITNVHFSVKTRTESYNGAGLANAVCIPFYVRNSYAVCTNKYKLDNRIREDEGKDQITSGHFRRWHIYNFIWHWRDGAFCPPEDPNEGGCVAALSSENAGSNCGYTDDHGGFWYMNCPANFNVSTEPATIAAVWGDAAIGSAGWGGPINLPTGNVFASEPEDIHECESFLFVDGKVGEKIELFKEKLSGPVPGEDRNYDQYDLPTGTWWWRNSPDLMGGMPKMCASQSCLGERVLNYHTDIDGFETKTIGWEEMESNVFAAYTGVIG